MTTSLEWRHGDITDAPKTSTIGIRQLKAELSRHLRRVEGGETITVTDRGRVIATINPLTPTGATASDRAMVARARCRR